MSNYFPFTHSVFYSFRELSAIFIKFKIGICKLFQFGRVKNFFLFEKEYILNQTKWGFNSLPHNPDYQWPWKIGLLKILWEKEKILVISIITFSKTNCNFSVTFCPLLFFRFMPLFWHRKALKCILYLSCNWRYLHENWKTCSLSKEQSILSRETIQKAFFFLELCPFLDLAILSYIKHPTGELWHPHAVLLFCVILWQYS